MYLQFLLGVARPTQCHKLLRLVYLFIILGFMEYTVLGAAEPFSVSINLSSSQIQAGEQANVECTIQIAPGHYLYKSETSLALRTQKGFRFVPAPMPTAKLKKDPNLQKEVEIYDSTLTLQGVLNAEPTVNQGEYVLEFEVRFQGCSPTTCFLPETRVVKVPIKVAGVSSSIVTAPQQVAAPAQQASGELATTLAQKGLLYTLAVCFVYGILLSLTPCVYPLLPITVGVIGAGSLGRPFRGFALSVAYVLGISLTYATLGVAAAATGRLFGSFAQSPWVTGFVCLVFFALSLSMLGLYELPMFTGFSERFQGRTAAGLVGVFVMGLVAGLVVSPCVGPVVVALLVYVSTTGNMALGFLMLFVMGWGMGLLLIILGTFSGALSLLPKSGGWMVLVKQFLGLLLLGAAFYYFKGLVSWPVFLVALGAALFLLSVFGGGFDTLTPESTAIPRLRKTFGLVCFVAGVCVMAALLLPLLGHNLSATGSTTRGDTGIAWVTSLQQGLDKAKTEGRPVIIDFWANWCPVCIHLDESTFTNPEVVREAQRFVAIKVDFTNSQRPQNKELAKQYGVVGLPTIIFIDSNGNVLKDKTINQYVSPEELLAVLRTIH